MGDNYIYLGIELGYDYAQISYYLSENKDVDTISTDPQIQKFRIPTAIFIQDSGKTYYGEEALKRAGRPDGEFYADLYRQAIRETGEQDLYTRLLIRFLNRLLHLSDVFKTHNMKYAVGLSVPRVNPDSVRVYHRLKDGMECDTDDFYLMDHTEAFYAHTYHQDASIWLHDVALYDFEENHIYFTLLHRIGTGKVQRITAENRSWIVPESVLTVPEHRDEFFANVVRESFEKKIISGIYLTGSGFDGDWLKESLRVIGTNKRVFLGSNLYTRGACYAVYRQKNPEFWPLYFDCDYKTESELELKVQTKTGEEYLPLITAGDNWFQQKSSLYLLYDGRNELEFRIRRPGSFNIQTKIIPLEELPDRPPKSIRLALICEPVSGNLVQIRVSDDGFGEIYPSSGKEWNFSIEI